MSTQRRGGKRQSPAKTKLKRGFKGPKVPTAEDRRTGFGRDDDAGPGAWLPSADGRDDDASESVGTTLSTKAAQRVQDELTQLQRALNNAAKEDNAEGINACVRLQASLDLALLGNEGRLDLGTALCLTARRGNLAAMRALLDHRANTEHESDDHRMRPLHFAVSHDKPQAVNMLIEAGADLHAPSDSGRPLTLGVNRGACDSVWELLRIDRCDQKSTDSTADLAPVGSILPPSADQISSFHTAVRRFASARRCGDLLC